MGCQLPESPGGESRIVSDTRLGDKWSPGGGGVATLVAWVYRRDEDFGPVVGVDRPPAEGGEGGFKLAVGGGEEGGVGFGLFQQGAALLVRAEVGGTPELGGEERGSAVHKGGEGGGQSPAEVAAPGELVHDP